MTNIFLISNLFLNKTAANCVQNRAMLKAFGKAGPTVSCFRDDNNVFDYILRLLEAKRTGSIVFTRSYSIATICGIFGIKCFYELHEIHENHSYKVIFRSSSVFFVFISSSLKSEFQRKIGRLMSKHAVIPLGCDVDLIDTVKALDKAKLPEIFLNERKKVLLHAGSTYKFHPARFEEIINSLPREWIFVQLGRASQELRSRFQHDDRVYFLPHCSHERSLLYQVHADALLYLNFPESRLYNVTSPLKLYEYIGTGKPFASTVGGATDEIISNLDVCGTFDKLTEFLKKVSRDDVQAEFLNQSENLRYQLSWDNRVARVRQYISEAFKD